MNKEQESMEDMMGEIEKGMAPIQRGDIVRGKVLSVNEQEALISIGYPADGVIAKTELNDDPEVNPQDILKAGDEIDVYVLKVNDGEGNIVLSKKRADSIKVWDEFAEYLEKDTTFNVQVKEIVKGGAVGYVKGVRVFIPASHLSYSYVKDLEQFIGKELLVKVIELDKEKRKVVLSRKEVEKVEVEAKKDALWASLKKGEKRKGVVSRLAKFGAFVDLGGLDGLIHLNDLSWKRVNNPEEVVSVGDQVEVYILDFDQEKGRVSLGLKKVEDNPWNNIEDKYKVGSIVEGKVIKFTNFGAFVELEPGIEGLVHISQISEERVTKPADVLTLGDKVKVKILEVKPERISLSIKEAADRGVEKEEYVHYNNQQEEKVTLGDLFKDKLKGIKFND